jgi:6-phosphogluconolactonase
MRVVVSEAATSAVEAAAVTIAEHVNAAIGERGDASLALSGGKTTGPMVRQLATLPVSWDRVHLWQVDERAVEAHDPDRNWLSFQTLRALMPASHLHPMPVEVLDADDLYTHDLHAVVGSPPVLDVVHLGLGSDGHTASLVPGSPVVDITDRDVSWVDEYQGHRRLTLTRPVLRAARQQVWLVVGSGKAEAASELLSDHGGQSPASVVAAGAVGTVFLDAAAAP